jgi:hypothetical protein
VIDLGREIVPPQRDAEQKPHAGHDAISIADAQPALDQVQLEQAYIVGRGSVGRVLQERREPLAAVDVYRGSDLVLWHRPADRGSAPFRRLLSA